MEAEELKRNTELKQEKLAAIERLLWRDPRQREAASVPGAPVPWQYICSTIPRDPHRGQATSWANPIGLLWSPKSNHRQYPCSATHICTLAVPLLYNSDIYIYIYESPPSPLRLFSIAEAELRICCSFAYVGHRTWATAALRFSTNLPVGLDRCTLAVQDTSR